MRSIHLMVFFALAASAAAAPVIVDLDEINSQELDPQSFSVDYPQEETENSSKIQRRSLGLLLRTLPDFYPLRSLISYRNRNRHRNRIHPGLSRFHNNHHRNQHRNHPYNSHNHGHNVGHQHGYNHGYNYGYNHDSRITPETVPTATSRATTTTTRATTTTQVVSTTTTTSTPRTTTTAIPTTTTERAISTLSPLDHDPNGELIYDIDLRFRS